ncbi:MAG: class I adenylate cyclase [Spirochaetes bacterium]|nr:class I adenylate cyclase [Spirochaetota bacterium]
MSFIEEIHKNKELFFRFNDLKYKRFQQLIGTPNIRRVVNSIPILLSTNNKRLPGFIEGDVPCGIENFKPDVDAKKYLQGRFYVRNIEIRDENPFVKMMAVMGSVGTIAYTRDSDFDYWVCIDRRSVAPEKLANFEKKVEAVQSWAMAEINIEVHIFINDITNIKNNIFAESNEEAFGSVIGAVLKDEFFRSSIIIAGKIPFWWVLPRFVRDVEYDKLYAQVPAEDREKYFVDLGNLFEISKEDFIGAALFLIIKSLGNPFKSIIKLGLLEKYLFDPESSPLLCQKIKSSILRGNMENRIVDSYILMFEEVYNYYESTVADQTILKILRQNLYLKINPQLSRYLGVKDRENLPYKVLVMFKYVKDWGWTGKEILALDNFESWDYKRTMVFWNMVKKFMLLSYQKIAVQLPELKIQENISESDFKLLSRKIKSHFAYEENKIDHYITFKDAPYESMIYIEPAAGRGIGDEEWSLLKKSKGVDDKAKPTVLRTEKGLVKLLAWTAINQIFNPKFSRLKVQSGYSRVTQNTVVDLISRISALFSGTLSKLKNEHYLGPAFNMVNIIIINFGIENADTIQTIHHIYETSWGESYIDQYASADDLVAILEKIVREGIIANQNFDEYCVIVSPEPFKKHYRDIEQMFREGYDFILRKDWRFSHRFVARLSRKFVTVTRDEDRVYVDCDADAVKTLMRISLNPRPYIAYSFFCSDPRLQILDSIYKTRKKNSITAVYEESGEYVLLYVINERDNIFTFIKPKQVREDAIIYAMDFCQNVIEIVNNYEGLTRINKQIQLFQLTVDRFGKFAFENKSQWAEELFLVKYRAKKAIHARIAKYKTAEPLYAISAGRESGSSYVPLKDVPAQVEELVHSDASICGMVHAIEFADMKENDIQLGSTPYFFEKYRMELVFDRFRR